MEDEEDDTAPPPPPPCECQLRALWALWVLSIVSDSSPDCGRLLTLVAWCWHLSCCCWPRASSSSTSLGKMAAWGRMPDHPLGRYWPDDDS